MNDWYIGAAISISYQKKKSKGIKNFVELKLNLMKSWIEQIERQQNLLTWEINNILYSNIFHTCLLFIQCKALLLVLVKYT